MRNNTIVALVVLVIVIALITWFTPFGDKQPTGVESPAPTETPLYATTTVTGVFVCLPHRGNGPSTMECAFGIKGDDGSYYALDWSDTSVSAFDLPMNTEYSVSGMYTPIEALSGNHWQIYDIKGVIRVSSYREAAQTRSYPLGATFTTGLKEAAMVGSSTIRVEAVVEDSRCPIDVQCIQAGRMRIALRGQGADGTATSSVITVGQPLAVGRTVFTLSKVEPATLSTHKISDPEYRFTFSTKGK